MKEEVRQLPDALVAAEPQAVVTAAVAPLVATPSVRAERTSEAVHGETLTVLERRDGWLRVRAGDGYHAWTHEGYLRTGIAEWSEDWDHRARGRSLGLELKLPEGRARLPLGARLVMRRDSVEMADGREGVVVSGALRSESEAAVEARLIAAPEWASRWFGRAPYLWGGRTDWGVDCSGLVQAVYAFRGVPLPRDTDLQLAAPGAVDVPLAGDGRGYEAGDLLFFTENGRTSHVAMWAGAGHIVHSSLSRGGLASDNLFGDSALARRLRDGLVGVRRF
jgi:cell wall-associated NlpC family hydrolase